MSPLRKVNKIRIATKPLSHKGTSRVLGKYEPYTLSESLSLCAFVASRVLGKTYRSGLANRMLKELTF